MKMWMARDKSGDLYLYKSKPIVNEGIWYCREGLWSISNYLFPEVTFENSPVEVELKLIEK